LPLNLSNFEKAIKIIEDRGEGIFTSLQGSSVALFFSMLKGSSLLLCHSEDTAAEIYSDAVFWSKSLGNDRPMLIPPKGDDLRLKSLWDLYIDGKEKLIASTEAVLSPVWYREEYPSLRLLRNSISDRDSLIETLKRYGYCPVPIVSGHGELSIRGGIVDVFPPEQDLPVRIEFFGDEIESIRYFDIDTQRTIKEIEELSLGPATEPKEGPNLLDVLRGRLILNEPDDIKRHYPELSQISRDKVIRLTSLSLNAEGFNLNIRGTDGLGLLPAERKDLTELVNRIRSLRRQYFILIVSSSEAQARRLKELFTEGNLDVPILDSHTAINHTDSPVITIGELSRGFVYDGNIILTPRDIFGERPVFRPLKRSRVLKLISSIEDFKEGDYLVHVDHGIGRFLGIRRQKIEDYEGDFIVIEYLEGNRLYVPLERINQVQKYHAPEGARPKIDKLGGRTWQKTKKRVRQKIRDMAEKLLSLYARRSTISGFAFSEDTELHREFDGFFTYEETPDQLNSIKEIKEDMESTVPMDRLLCGDVGYGKTEVVMRACFKAVYDSKQVAVLVPTTILAEQHYDTFCKRFAAFPIKIDYLSRFKTRSEQRQTLEALERGDIDIIIGTHRLLGNDVKFYNLGLLVIDEEHRFGVAHKEKIKALKTNIDVLSLSATPIPRTLYMALSGIRSMSVIETPPEERLAVKSFVVRFNPQIIKDALQKELDRGGQAFFVHNRVQDIYKMAGFIKRLVPEARVAIAHGQMRERELEQIMRAFFRREIDVLVSTAIIGSGLDIPSANTIIINRADKFGLADLYQLRGRVGRSNIKAYAYFLIPTEEIITEEARKKLQAIQELSYLGAGFRLALKDLEIRGAGNLLGPEQSGHIEAVGFDMYIEMLESAISELKGEKVPPKIEPVIDLKATAIIPEEYIENPEIRLSIYRRIASARDKNSLEDLRDELKDRFGTPPQETLRLLEIMDLKLLAKNLLITRIQNIAGKIKVVFAPETPITPERIFSLYKSNKRRIRLLPEGGIEIDLKDRGWDEMLTELKKVIQTLS
jgi:transcription-repair coupling factor (superfamily II helicase)